ncbi:helix-turn-helix transcriptional regulator [Sphingobium terrigena]|nr:helix-turn-helix transcriptional regulator [Sphingobium terrigena]
MIRSHAKPDISDDPSISPTATEAEIGEIARQFHRFSLRRSEALGQPVSDPGWNMLLALVADMAEYRPSCVTSLCYASGAPMTTALRHLARLESSGLIYRREHRHDSRKSIMEAAPRTMAVMYDLILSFCVAPPSGLNAAHGASPSTAIHPRSIRHGELDPETPFRPLDPARAGKSTQNHRRPD